MNFGGIFDSFIDKLNASVKELNPLNKKNCSYCDNPFTEELWCKSCDPYFKIEGWTSGNSDVDKLIKDTIYEARNQQHPNFLEWVPLNRFQDPKPIGEGGFSKVYS